MDAEILAAVAAEAPGTQLEAGESLDAGVELAPVLVRCTLAKSLADARRQLEQHGIAVNGAKVDADRRLGPGDLLQGRWILLRKGKRDWAVVDASG